MYRIMIVDDDTIVRMYLKDMIKWEEYGFCVACMARDGVEALELTCQFAPDVILTDISMPRMDGVELISSLRKKGYQGVINVLSCHDDFDFVRGAMQQGADDYLLKNHLNPAAMSDILEKITLQIQSRLAESGKKDEMERLVCKGIDVVQREFLESILRSDEPVFVEEYQIRQVKLRGAYRRLLASMIQPTDADRNQVLELKTLCAQKMEGEPTEILLLNDQVLVLLIDLTEIPSIAQSLEILCRMKKIVTHIAKQYLNIEVSIASSAVCEGKYAMSNALHQAKETLQNRFYGSGNWQYGCGKRISRRMPEKAELFQRKLLTWLKDGDQEILLSAYQEALREIREAWVAPGTVQQWIHRCDHIVGIARSEEAYAKIDSLELCGEIAQEYLAYWHENHMPQLPPNLSPAMAHAVEYVQRHFCEPIGLNEAAKAAKLSPAYFSTSFKKEMGVGFSEYLMRLRLEKVCHRLQTSGGAIKQISQEAGFWDYPHFCRIFKKNMGVSPAVYRKML